MPGTRRWLLVAVLVAFVLRAGAALLPLEFRAPDTDGYDAPARSLARGEGYLDGDGHPTAERPPGYPGFLALVYRLSGSTSTRTVGLAQAALGAATVALLHRLLARRHPRAALLAAFILALDPVAIGVSPYVLREALLLFLLTAALVLIEVLRARGPLARGLVLGASLAALALTHQLYILLGPFLLLGQALARRPLRHLIIAGVVVLAAWMAWGARNRTLGTGELTLTSYPVPAGELWLMSESTHWWLHDDPTTGYQDAHFREIARLKAEHGGDIALVKSELYARAWANVRQDPLAVVGRAARINAWYWLEVPGSVRITLDRRLWVLRLGLIPFHWLRLFWAIVGLVEVHRRRERGEHAPEIAAWAFLALAPAALLPLPRYLSPLAGVLDGFAAIGIALWRERRQRALTSPATTVDAPGGTDPRRS